MKVICINLLNICSAFLSFPIACQFLSYLDFDEHEHVYFHLYLLRMLDAITALDKQVTMIVGCLVIYVSSNNNNSHRSDKPPVDLTVVNETTFG